MSRPLRQGGIDGPALALRGVRRRFRQGGEELEVLRGVDLQVRPGEITALVGPSGAGKSTLLHIAGLLERQSVGEVEILGRTTSRLGEKERTAIRRDQVGFVYQFHHLLADFTALENVMLPRLLAGVSGRRARESAAAILERLGLGHRLGHRPARLSGGEQQRVAIARALANKPAILLADEPTGNLDAATAEQVFGLLLEVTHAESVAALIATHNPELAARMDRTVEMRAGHIVEREEERLPA